jgi:restriction system protein
MKSYYRVLLGRKGINAAECFAGGFICCKFGIREDLTEAPEELRNFSRTFIPIYMAYRPDKTRISAGLACAALWFVAKGIEKDDIVLCPDGSERYRVGEVIGDYEFATDAEFPHRRPVRWLTISIDRADMSEGLRNLAGSIDTVCDLTRAGFADEIEKLITTAAARSLIATDATVDDQGAFADMSVDDPTAFAMEKQLEDFLVRNWARTELGKQYDIYEEEGEIVGRQYPTDTGPVDILAISKDKKKLLVVELKKGRASDVVVGQISRYMGYVQEELAEDGQSVVGAIIALADDQRIRRALKIIPNIAFYRYEISVKLVRV